MRVSEIAWDEGLEPFLTSSVPELKAIVFGLIQYIFG
jgi:hypothetical protein